MAVKININPVLYQHTNNQSMIEVDGNTVGQCLNQLVKQFPDMEKALFDKNSKLLSYVDIYVNEESSYPEELAKPVKEGDNLYIAIMLAGVKRIEMIKRRVTLTFTPETIAEPIIYNIAQQFNVVTNITQAEITRDRGWIEVELEGAEEDIEEGIAWAISKGVRVEPTNDEMA